VIKSLPELVFNNRYKGKVAAMPSNQYLRMFEPILSLICMMTIFTGLDQPELLKIFRALLLLDEFGLSSVKSSCTRFLP
jgi:hypothetical protein